MKRLKNRGDTIIEVLVALAVLGFVMTLTYTIATRAQQTVRRAQERVEALKLAEGQLEQLKALQQNNVAQFKIQADLASTRPFCFTNGGGLQNFGPGPADISALALENDDLTSLYPANCEDRNPGGLYNISITAPDNNTGGAFTLRVRWARFGGGGNDEVKLDYRLYEDN